MDSCHSIYPALGKLPYRSCGEGYAVTGPAAAISEKEVGLGAAGTYVGVGKVVAAADEASVRGTDVVD